MKIEQLIVQHLYNNKKVTLQEIGTFTLSPEVSLPMENEKDFTMPANAVSFVLNKKAQQDEELISFIVAQTRKIKPLATSDLESYSLLAKQFLNIGKPFPIEGLGVLQKTQSGEYEFLQGSHINAKLDAAPALLKEKTEEEISFSTTGKAPGINKSWIIALLSLFIIAVAVSLFVYLRKGNKDNSVEKVIPTMADSLVTNADTTLQTTVAKPDTSVAPSVVVPKDSSTFKIVIKEYPSKEAAEKAFTKLSSFGHKLQLVQKDSTGFKLVMPFYSPLADTLRARDSLQIFFGGKPYIEKNQ